MTGGVAIHRLRRATVANLNDHDLALAAGAEGDVGRGAFASRRGGGRHRQRDSARDLKPQPETWSPRHDEAVPVAATNRQ